MNILLEKLRIDKNVFEKTFNCDENLMLRFVNMFPSDDNFQKLEEYFKQNDFENMFESAHTLKGLCSNLGFTELYKLSSILVENLRHNNYGNLSVSFENLKKEYLRVMHCFDIYK